MTRPHGMLLATGALLGCTQPPTEPDWTWALDDQGEFFASNVADGHLSIVTSDAAGTSRLLSLDAETADVTTEYVLAGDDVPELPFRDVADSDDEVEMATFVARDRQGRTYVLHAPTVPTDIPTRIYRYEADATKAWVVALRNRGHDSLQIEPDGQGGALVVVRDEPAGLTQVIRIAEDGAVAWEIGALDESLVYGFGLDGDSLWVTHTDSWSKVSLETGEMRRETQVLEPPDDMHAYRAAPAPEGDLYLLGKSGGTRQSTLFRVRSDGEIDWTAEAADEGDWSTYWTLDLDVLDDEGVCTGTPLEPTADETPRQALHCFDTKGRLIEELGPVRNGDGGIDLDAEGNLYTTDLAPHRVLVRYPSVFSR